jgi:hypothetical protein
MRMSAIVASTAPRRGERLELKNDY